MICTSPIIDLPTEPRDPQPPVNVGFVNVIRLSERKCVSLIQSERILIRAV